MPVGRARGHAHGAEHHQQEQQGSDGCLLPCTHSHVHTIFLLLLLQGPDEQLSKPNTWEGGPLEDNGRNVYTHST